MRFKYYINEDVYDSDGEYNPSQDSRYKKILRTPINKISRDDIAYLYTIHLTKHSNGYYSNGKQSTYWSTNGKSFEELLRDNEDSRGDDFDTTYKFISSLSFPLTVYRAIRDDELKSGNISGKNRSNSWTVDPRIYFKNNSMFKNANNIVSAEITPDMIQNEWTIVNYILYSARPSYGFYAESEISLKPQYKMDKLNNLRTIDKEELRKELNERLSTMLNEEDNREKKYDNVGYHYGDLGKADFKHNFGDRNTGGFGTGTYFVGTPISQRKDAGSTYKNRHERIVDFSQYNLFEPRNNDQAYLLHDGLLWLNNHYNETFIEDSDKIWDEYDKMFDQIYPKDTEQSDTDLDLDLDDLDLDEAYESVSGLNIKPILNYLRKYSKYLPDRIPRDSTDQDLLDMTKDIRNKLTSEAREYRDNVWKIVQGLGYIVSESKLKQIIKKVMKDKTDIAPSTLLMKELGFDGIDVRHLNKDENYTQGLDNFGYGSVIYDIKPESIIK